MRFGMKRLCWFLFGVGSVLIAIGAGCVIFLHGSRGFSARAEPSFAETLIAKGARQMAMPEEAERRANPVLGTPEVIAEARAHWADHCATCQANNGSGDTEMGRHFYPPAPDMRKRATQDMSDGELFYIIENGVRLSGMPAWGSAEHGEEDSWKLVHFIRRLPSLSITEQREMEKLNPKSPEEREEERQEEQFLKREDTHEQKEPMHHH
jgi:hypothetical protein